MSFLKRLVRSPRFQKAAGVMAAEYLRLVFRTTRFVYEPEPMYAEAEALAPVIVGMWHGQHFLMPFLRRGKRAKVLVSRHRDGEINAIAAQHLGVGTIRGSGGDGREFQSKGGVGAFREMLDALEQGYAMALTADVPKVSRVAGVGIAKLASMSGRPIFLVAIATRPRITLNNWDRSVVNLPFGRGAMVGDGPIYVPTGADDAALEAARQDIETRLNAITARAYEIVDRPRGGSVRGIAHG
ncbi:MAG: lysophospholipid acyltransferase family protein [Xanthobacteraceae bacterium]